MSKVNKKNVDEEIKIDTAYNKSFDEIMNEILGEENENKKSDKELFEEMINEVSIPFDVMDPGNCVEEVENTQIYRFSDNARIGLFNAYSLDTGFGDGYREITLIQTSDLLEVIGSFNTRELKIEKNPDKYKYGQIKFIDKQRCDSLTVENVGVFGSFNVAIVSIHDSSFIDINLDILDKSKCTYVLIDARFDRVRGKINMSKDFYNQLNNENRDMLMNINRLGQIKISVENKNILHYIADYELQENINEEYDDIRQMLDDMRTDI